MKNHIKNYIKIMGLVAVPFGTAQAGEYKIKVTQEYKCDPNDPKSEKDGAMWFYFSVSLDGGKPRKKAICWYVDSDVYYLKYGKRHGESSCPIQTVPYLSRYMIKKIKLRLEPALCDKEELKWKERYNDVRFAYVKYPGVRFFVVRDPERKYGNTVYKLIIIADDRFGRFYVSSDVPTMVSGTMGSYCSDNEIVGSRQEEPFCVQTVDGKFFAYCKNPASPALDTTIDKRDFRFFSGDWVLVAEYNMATKRASICELAYHKTVTLVYIIIAGSLVVCEIWIYQKTRFKICICR
ncbi:MAG: hypothetical protein IJ793_02665 [Opitutales bacterium]|nr:hypothetical protein [Opitutales bacterium]